MERVNGYLAADGSFFTQEDACLRYEREQLRFYALSKRLEILLEPSTTGQKPDVSPEIADLLETAGAWDCDSALCLFLKHIRQLLRDNDGHFQLDALIRVTAYLVDE